MLDIIEDIYDPDRDQIFRFIHCTLSNPDQYERISRYPIIIETQPIFMTAVPLVRQRIGEERAGNSLRFKSWLNNGIRITGGDDSPICDNNPFVEIRYAVLRETISLHKAWPYAAKSIF